MDFPIFLDRSIKCRNWTHAKSDAVVYKVATAPPWAPKATQVSIQPFWRARGRTDDGVVATRSHKITATLVGSATARPKEGAGAVDDITADPAEEKS